MYTVSPDTEELLTALSTVKHGASIVPEDIDASINQILSDIGGEVALTCIGKSPQQKRMILIGYALCMRAVDKTF